jgi:hypothetical protein
MKILEFRFLTLTAFLAMGSAAGWAQEQESARAAAPVDLTGNWVAPVMEDWRWRMVTPLKGDAASIPLRPAAREVIESWDPARDEAAGEQCKAYGAAALMRLPGRIRIGWDDANTLRIEKDHGMQTRLLQFDPEPAGPPSRQGRSVAHWDRGLPPGPAGVGFLGAAPRVGTRSKTLTVETSNLLPGYLRKNGIPYSDRTTVTEYFDTFTAVDGSEWFTITTVVDDPVYLTIPFVTTTDYKREADDSGWNPEPCTAY